MKYFLSVLALLLSSLLARADEFYCMVYAVTDNSNPYYYCHVWGTFVQMEGDKLVKRCYYQLVAAKGYFENKVQGLHLSLDASF